MANGFIENGYWYQLKNMPVNIKDLIFDAGYDVHILNFIPKRTVLNHHKNKQTDASFREIVGKHIPNYMEQMKKGYRKIHLIGHSYGSTLLASWLMGYSSPGMNAPVISNPLLSQKNQLGITSFISLSGFYGINWNFFENNFFPALAQKIPEYIDSSYSNACSTFSLYTITKLSENTSHLHTGSLGFLKPFANKKMSRFIKFTPKKLMPFANIKNANHAALTEALAYGSLHESWETFDSMLSMTRKNYQGYWKSKLYSYFYESLAHLKIPVIFIQGSMDLMSPPSIIKKFGYDLIGSSSKEFFTIPDTGHQDLLTPKNPAPLYEKLCDWINAS